MRSALLVSAFAAFAAASPRPQELDFDAIADAPDPAITGPPVSAVQQTVNYDSASLAQSAAAEVTADPLTKRVLGENDPCGPQPDGYGPKPPTDDPTAFLAYPLLRDVSTKALTPAGYSLAFSNKQGSVNGNIYLGLTTIKTYDPQQCAALCDAKSGCMGFNIYFERDPTINPAPACPNPAGFTNVKCTLWGGGVNAEIAVNTGQTRESFIVVISGSNGYNRRTPPATIDGFTGPVALGGAINAPLTANGTNTYLGVKFFTTPYFPDICALACKAQTAYNRRHPNKDGSYKPCNFFAAYVTSINNVPQGLYCSLYTQAWDPKYATNQGQYRGRDYYSISRAYSYTLSPLDNGYVFTDKRSKSKGDKSKNGHGDGSDSDDSDNDD